MLTVGFHTLKTQYLSHPDFYQEYKLYYNIHGPLIENSGTRGDFFYSWLIWSYYVLYAVMKVSFFFFFRSAELLK